jgi:hypothetical protein
MTARLETVRSVRHGEDRLFGTQHQVTCDGATVRDREGIEGAIDHDQIAQSRGLETRRDITDGLQPAPRHTLDRKSFPDHGLVRRLPQPRFLEHDDGGAGAEAVVGDGCGEPNVEAGEVPGHRTRDVECRLEARLLPGVVKDQLQIVLHLACSIPNGIGSGRPGSDGVTSVFEVGTRAAGTHRSVVSE